MHTDTQTLHQRVAQLREARDRGDLTQAEVIHLIDVEAAYCALHGPGSGDDAA